MQFVDFLAGATCFFLLLISLHLFFAKKGNRRQNILFAVLLFARFGQILNSLLIASGRVLPLSFFYQFFTPFYLAAPACFYLYLTGFVYQKKSFQKTDLLHFIPMMLAILHVIPWSGISLDWKLILSELQLNAYHTLRAKSGLFPSYIHSLLRPALTLSYLSLSWIAVIRSKRDWWQRIDEPTRRWTLFLLYIVSFFQLLGLLRTALLALGSPINHTLFVVINCISILLILVYTLHTPRIFYGFLLVAIDWKKDQWQHKDNSELEINTADSALPEIIEKVKPINHPAKKINLSNQHISAYQSLIEKEMEQERLYLNADLQIIDLASRLNIPLHQCSYVINNHIGKNFRDWINSYRVNHFLAHYPILADKMTIEAIAQEAGFKSQATFYNAFKKEKGVMPKVYFAQEAEHGARLA